MVRVPARGPGPRDAAWSRDRSPATAEPEPRQQPGKPGRDREPRTEQPDSETLNRGAGYTVPTYLAYRNL